MRLIGIAQRSLELMCRRVESRVAFGKKLSEQGSIRQDIAKSRCDIEQARLLTLAAADKMDREGNKGAADLISMIKIVAPQMAQRVIDRAMQAHGGMGLCQDTPMAAGFAYARFVRLADGPDEVHMAQLAKWTIAAALKSRTSNRGRGAGSALVPRLARSSRCGRPRASPALRSARQLRSRAPRPIPGRTG